MNIQIGYKRIFALILIPFLCFAFSFNPAMAKGKVPNLSTKTIVLKAKKSKTIKVTGTSKSVKWKVVGKKLVTITAKGKKKHTLVIKAKNKAGKCSVQARVGKKTLKCKVTVKLSGKVSKDKFVNAFDDTAFRLLKDVAKTSNGNILISPDSIITALTMTGNGAAGNTLKEMKSTFGNLSFQKYNTYLYKLHKRIKEDKHISYHSANSIWYKAGNVTLADKFIETNKKYHNAEIKGVAFDQSTVQDINNWVSDNTKGMIPSIIDELKPPINLALINAIAFEGKWADQYTSTVKRTFTLGNGTKKKVPMLEGTEESYLTLKGGTGFIKPYEGGRLAFMGLLPPKGTSVDNYVKKLKGLDFANAYLNRKTTNIKVETRMPEFKYDYNCSLKNTLERMGMKQAFSPGKANFSLMFVPSSLQGNIDKVIHKSHIELDKNGTKAAAVTAVLIKDISAIVPDKKIIKKKVYLNRPFVYCIIDTKTGIPLFLGILRDL